MGSVHATVMPAWTFETPLWLTPESMFAGV
jgi:hypothetical protein